LGLSATAKKIHFECILLYAIECNDPDACRGDKGLEEEKEEECTATLRRLMQ
jgi:hypothetical protein